MKVEIPATWEPDAQVPCGKCRLCCQGYSAVMLQPHLGDDVSAYETTTLPAPGMQPRVGLVMDDAELAGMLFLKFRPNGDCWYLNPDGCTIHGRAPFICRTYDCREQHRMYTRAQRDELVRRHVLDPAILKRAAIMIHQQMKAAKGSAQ